MLCKGKDEIVAQYALTGYDQPIGISDYQLSKAVPENLKSALPSIEQVEEELTMLLDNEKNKQSKTPMADKIQTIIPRVRRTQQNIQGLYRQSRFLF